MNYATALVVLVGCLGLSACGDDDVDPGYGEADPVYDEDGADDFGIDEGGPESARTETPYETVVPEWEEEDSGELADGTP